MSTLKRLLLALLMASLFVVILYVVLIHRYFKAEEKEKNPDLVPIERLSERETRELFDYLGMEYDPKPKGPDLDIPDYQIPRLEYDGFVMLEVLVRKDGTVATVDVIGAKPEGLYEEQAIAEVKQNRYPVKKNNGIAVAYEIEEIVEFNTDDVKKQTKQ